MENRVRDLREGRGLSQGQLAAALGVSRQTINAIETERYTPSLPLALALAQFFYTNVEAIFRPDAGHKRGSTVGTALTTRERKGNGHVV